MPDRLFHVRIAEASGNSVLALVVAFLWEQRKGPLWGQIEKHFHTPALLQKSVEDHAAILGAIAAHDAPGARRAMRAHLNRVSREFARGWQRHSS